ncbi:hypothetical protein CR513_55512, partial [Mucuna pruriens]
MDRSIIDVASGGALMDKMPIVARHLISNMASNTQQFGIRGAAPSRMVNEIGVIDKLRLENQLIKLTSLVRQLAVGQHQPSIAARVCGICTSMEHPIDMCPTLQETESNHPEVVGSIGGYQYGKQSYQSLPYDKIKIWPEHASKSKQLSAESEIPTAIVLTAVTTESATTRGLDEAVGDKQLGVSTYYELQQHQNLDATIQDLKTQVGQLANTVSQLQSVGSRNLPSQTIPNLTRNANVLKGGNQYSTPGCHKADPDVCKILEGFVHAQEEKDERRGGIGRLLPDHSRYLQRSAETPKFSLSHAPLVNLTNRSIVQPLGVLEDVLVQVNELIFPTDFYVLEVEDETFGKGSTLILG